MRPSPTPHRRTARALIAATVLSIAAGLYAATATPWLCIFGLYPAAFTAWCSARYYAAHRRQLEEEAWEEKRVLRRAPAPLNPCCTLARHSWGEAHALNCTDVFHRLTARSTAEHSRSST